MTTLLRETKAARQLNVSPRTLQRWRIEGKGPKFVKLGKLVGYTEADLDEFIKNARRQSTSER